MAALWGVAAFYERGTPVNPSPDPKALNCMADVPGLRLRRQRPGHQRVHRAHEEVRMPSLISLLTLKNGSNNAHTAPPAARASRPTQHFARINIIGPSTLFQNALQNVLEAFGNGS